MEVILTALKKIGAPPMFSKAVMTLMAETGPLPVDARFRNASFTSALTYVDGSRVPQAIAHRGYKSKYPENTMAAFRGAVAVGVHALETDVHVSRDGVVVLSHDPSLKRCYGVDKKISEHDWKDLKELRTTQPPHEPLPRLEDLLDYLAQPATGKIWVLLDIKNDNDPDKLMRAIASALKKFVQRSSTPWENRWENRIVLGCWAACFMPACATYLSGFSISNIGFSPAYSQQFLTPDLPHISFNMLFAVLLAPSGRRFIRAAQAAERPIYAWTVNDTVGFEWCIKHGIDGIISDDPQKYVEYLKVRDDNPETRSFAWRDLKSYIITAIFAFGFELLFWWGWGFHSIQSKLLARKKIQT